MQTCVQKTKMLSENLTGPLAYVRAALFGPYPRQRQIIAHAFCTLQAFHTRAENWKATCTAKASCSKGHCKDQMLLGSEKDTRNYTGKPVAHCLPAHVIRGYLLESL